MEEQWLSIRDCGRAWGVKQCRRDRETVQTVPNTFLEYGTGVNKLDS